MIYVCGTPATFGLWGRTAYRVLPFSILYHSLSQQPEQTGKSNTVLCSLSIHDDDMGSTHQKKEGFPRFPGKGNLRQSIMFCMLMIDMCIGATSPERQGY